MNTPTPLLPVVTEETMAELVSREKRVCVNELENEQPLLWRLMVSYADNKLDVAIGGSLLAGASIVYRALCLQAERGR